MKRLRILVEKGFLDYRSLPSLNLELVQSSDAPQWPLERCREEFESERSMLMIFTGSFDKRSELRRIEE